LVLVTMQSMVKTVFYCSDPRNMVSKPIPGTDRSFSFTHAKTLNHPAWMCRILCTVWHYQTVACQRARRKYAYDGPRV